MWSNIKSFVKDNHNYITFEKYFMDILLDETVVNKAIFCDPVLSARPGGNKVQVWGNEKQEKQVVLPKAVILDAS